MNTKNATERILKFAKILSDAGVKITEVRPYIYKFDFGPSKVQYCGPETLCALEIAAKDLGAEVRCIKPGSLTNADFVIKITDPAAYVLDQFLAA